jgi:hypothetical protein
MAEKNRWFFGVKMVSVLKLGVGIAGLTPVATYLVVGYVDKEPLHFGFLVWAFFWLIYLWNATSVFRLQTRARGVAIALDLVYIVLYWKAFIDVGVSLSLLSFKALHGLLPFIFIAFLLLPKASDQFKKA